MNVSRRQWATAIAGAAAAAALPQTAEPQQPAQTPDAEMQAARASLQASVQALRTLPLPMAVEPAVKFATKG